MDYMKIRTTLLPRLQPDGTTLTDNALAAAAVDLITKGSLTTPEGDCEAIPVENVRITKRGLEATLTYARYLDDHDLFLTADQPPKPQLPEPSLEVRLLRQFLADLTPKGPPDE